MCMICVSDPVKLDDHCKYTDDSWTIALVVDEDSGDAAASSATSYSVMSGDTFNGELSPAGERDWIELSLSAGETVTISMTGVTLPDPYLRLRDAGGNLVAQNDDIQLGVILDSELTYTSASGGTFYIDAGSYNDVGSGTYTIDVAPPAPYDPLDAMDWGGATVPGTGAGGGVIDVYFAAAGETFDGVTSEGANAYEIQQFQEAFDIFEAYTNLTFNVVNSAAGSDFQIVIDTNGELSALGYFNPPGTTGAGVGVFNGNGTGWDRSAGGGLEVGGYGFITIVHELGHGLGLSHPHDNGGGSSILPGVSDPFSDTGIHFLNQGVFTTMSYIDGFAEGDVGTAATTNNYGYQAGPMALDLGLLQPRYGTNMSTNTGATNYDLPTMNASGTYWYTIWDASGDDTITNPGSSDSTIDLRAATLLGEFGGGGFISAADNIQGGYTIANGAVIENATGGSGADNIIGNSADNVLNGNGGMDTIFGDSGFDTISGGGGADDINGSGGRDNITGDNGADTIAGGFGGDTIQGGLGSDDIQGGGGTDLLEGGGNDDTLRGGAGDDTIRGGSGNDSIIGNLRADVLDGGIGNDTLRGNEGRDTITGGDGDDSMRGETGADTFVFEDGFGNDTIADFDAFNNAEEIDLSGVSSITDYTDLTANHMTQVGGYVMIDAGMGNTIRISGVNIADLNPTDFVF